MSDFEEAVKIVLKNEGGLVDDPADPGGLTNKGISLRFLLNIPVSRLKNYGINYSDESHLRELLINLNDAEAKQIYKGEFWDEALFSSINNQKNCNYIFDAAVNLGISTAIKIAQRAVNAVNGNENLIEDGILGNHTIDEINHCAFYLLPALRAERAGEYRLIAIANPKIKKDLKGWLIRAYCQ